MIQVFELDFIIKAMQAQILSRLQQSFEGVGTDTRVSLKGQIFFALKGENFDAHDFLDKAVLANAGAVVVDHLPEKLNDISSQVTCLLVKDTLKALQALASAWRKQNKAKILGITGSNGKTTTKEFAAAIIGSQKQVHFNQGSFNNHWGLPLTLLGIRSHHNVAICEMGMNHPGELTELSQIAQADVVVCTTVGRAHLEGLGSLEGVARAKEEIYLAAPAQAVRIYNLDNTYTEKMLNTHRQKSMGIRYMTFSQKNEQADVYLRVVSAGLEGLLVNGHISGIQGEQRVPVFGEHNVINVMAAAALALSSGLTPEQIWQALPLCKMAWGRNQLVQLKNGARVLFDGYNANPDSMQALIKTFAGIHSEGKKILVLGEMREMGEQAYAVHRELGEAVAREQFTHIWFMGPSWGAFQEGALRVNPKLELTLTDDFDEKVAAKLLQKMTNADVAALKGSRGMKLERVVKAWQPINFGEK